MLDYDDEIMQDDDWLYEEEPKKKPVNKSFNNGEKRTPPEWTLKGCETVDDPAEKERLRKELEKKERRRQQNREAQKRWQEKKKAEKEAAKEREKAEQPKMTFSDVAEEPKEVETTAEEPNVDESLDRLAKLREMAENETTNKTNLVSDKSMELEENVRNTKEIEEVEPAPDQEVSVPETAPAMTDDITLALTTSEAESLYEFIKDELLTVVKRDDIEEMDWLVDMCSIYSGLRKVLIQNG